MDRHSYYSKHLRDPVAAAFYNSRAWRRKSKDYLRRHPICERCGRLVAQHCHHKIPFAQCTSEQLYDDSNLLAVDIGCHNILEADADPTIPVTAFGTLTVVEDERYHYDPEAAEKPIRFIEKYCSHYEGAFAGQPFTLLEWQKHLIRQLFGWVDRITGLRRFEVLYCLSSKGAGKTPLFAAIALYCLLGEKEPGAHCVSMASTFEQANHTSTMGRSSSNSIPTSKSIRKSG